MFFKITNIDYDLDTDLEVDGELPVQLPDSFIVQISDMAVEVVNIETMLSDYISDRTGFCHNGFDFEQIEG